MAENLEEKISKAKELARMFASEAGSSVKYGDEISKYISRLTVPKTSDGKSHDFQAFINALLAGVEPIVAKYFGDGRDPQWTVGAEQLKNILDTFENPVDENGQLREAVRNQIVGAYQAATTDYVQRRGVARGTRVPLDQGKEYGTKIAEIANPALKGVVGRATTPDQLQRALGTVLPRYQQNVGEAYNLTGKVTEPVINHK